MKYTLYVLLFFNITISAFECTIPQLPRIQQEERCIIVIIPSYNNAQWYDRNLSTLFAQQYSNFHVVYIDDCSTDGTAELVQAWIAAHGVQHKVTFIQNAERHGAMYNLFHAIYACPDYAIICTYDGDDWMPDDNKRVFQIINAAYADQNVWLTYGQYKTYNGPHRPSTPGICKPIPDYVIKHNRYRQEEWCMSHMRTFYAGLFKKIEPGDMMVNGSFYPVTWDQCFMFPLAEMAAGRIMFISDVIYVYNQANVLNDFRQHGVLQLEYERQIRRKAPYVALDEKEMKHCFVQYK